MGVTSPDSIYAHDGSGPASLVTVSQTMASSIQAAFDKRERYDYVWANSAERAAQTGMVQSSRGYQIDTKSEYLYDNSAWRLAVPYAEYSKGSQGVNSGVYTGVSGWSVVSSATTDTNLVSITNYVVTFINPGVYNISMTTGYSGSPTGGFTTITPDIGHLSWYDIGEYIQTIGTTGSFIRTTTANQTVYLWTYQASGGLLNLTFGNLRIVRLG